VIGARLQFLALALGIPAVLAAGSFAFVGAVLPRPSATDAIAVRILQKLETTRGARAHIRLGRRTFVSECRVLSRNRRGIFLDDGTRLFLHGSHFTVSSPSREWRTIARLESPEFPAAAADLGGSHFLYVVQLARSIVRGRHVVLGTIRFGGRETYRVRLSRGRPLVELLVDRMTLEPVAAHYRSARLEGWSRLYGVVRRKPRGLADPVTKLGC